MSLAEPIGITFSVSAVLERLGVDYLVGGSLASSLHGIPRATLDVDIVADLRMVHVGDVLGILRTQGERLDREYLHRWATRKGLDELLEGEPRGRQEVRAGGELLATRAGFELADKHSRKHQAWRGIAPFRG